MKKYKLTYLGKEYFYNGEHTEEVIEKFSRRMVFGNPIIVDYHIKQYDADTRGEVWAQYKSGNDFIMIELIQRNTL